MAALTATAKGSATRETIVDRAFVIARANGLEGLSIGPLAQAVGMSKSGVFAHFGSREGLQLAVLSVATERFLDHVLRPALKQPRGLARLQAIMTSWFDWVRQTGGGCVLLSAVAEYDDRPGPLHDWIVTQQARWRQELARCIQIAIDEGQLAADTDPMQLAFEIYGLSLIVHHDSGLFGYGPVVERGQRAYQRLIRSYSPHSPSGA